MRVLPVLLVASLLIAGCITGNRGTGPTGPPAAGLPVPIEAVLAEGNPVKTSLNGSVHLEWKLSFKGTQRFNLTVPPEAVVFRAQYKVSDTLERSFSLIHKETGTNRCPTTASLRYSERTAPLLTCTGLAVLDTESRHPANYTLALQAARPQNSADVAGPQAPAPQVNLQLEIAPGPIQGPAGAIDLSALAPVAYKLARPTSQYIRSTSDDARLFVEVNLPDGPGPWPTILISSPYNQPARDAGLLTQGSRVRDFVPRGYAVVVADVRGFANSEGCVEVWGPKEQQDQVDLVEWVARQTWSNGKVAMYGQSYVGTTPHEAAIKQAPSLTTIATVAGLTDPYFDWHYGGVPNGESTGSPAAYSLLTDAPPKPPGGATYVPDWLHLARTQGCDLGPMMAQANDPNAVYGEFYKLRNFSAKARDIKVPVLYTQGYIDANVKSTQALRFFNDIPTPKLGFFGPWLHRHPPRGDFELILHAWMDHWLQGRATRIMDLPTAQAITNLDTLRSDTEWPPSKPLEESLFLHYGNMSFGPAKPPGSSSAQFRSAPSALGTLDGTSVRLRSWPITAETHISGEIRLELDAKLDGAANVHFAATLYDEHPGGRLQEIRFGMLNAGLRNSYERFEPVPAGQTLRYHIKFLPVEYVLLPNHRLVLDIGSTGEAQSLTPPGEVTVFGGNALRPAALVLPTVDAGSDIPAPSSVLGPPAFRPSP